MSTERAILQRFNSWCEWLRSKNSVALLCRHGTFYQDIESLLRSGGVETKNFAEDAKDIQRMIPMAKEKSLGGNPFALTVNFFPPLAVLTAELGMPYAAWVVDSTLNVHVHDPAYARPTAHVFVFDERDVRRFTSAGYPNVHHMPQSSNEERMRKLDLSPQDMAEFGADVAFVGDALIWDCNEYRNLFLPEIDKLIEGETDPMARRALRLTKLSCEETMAWFDEHPMALVDEISARLKEKEGEYHTELAKIGVGDFEHLAILVAKEAARRQRHAIVRSLSDIGVSVWGEADWMQVLDGKNRYRGKADHWSRLPLVYNATRINLNITRPYSDRGAPMRVFDVTACGGFLLTNHAHTVKQWFVPGKEVETYESLPELKEKILYYLAHEEERRRIAEAGRLACVSAHTHKHRLCYIFSELFGSPAGVDAR